MKHREHVVYGVRASNAPTFEYRYVGLTSDLESRQKSHKVQSLDPRSRAYHTPKSKWMRRHLNLVEFDILEICDTIDEMKFAEMKWIHILRERGHRLLNLTEGGEGTFGWEPHDEWRAKQSARMSVPANNPNMFKAGIDHPMYGKSISEEHRQRISDGKMGLKNPRCNLTAQEIRAIREARDNKVPYKEIMSKYGVSQKTVYRISKGVRYSDI